MAVVIITNPIARIKIRTYLQNHRIVQIECFFMLQLMFVKVGNIMVWLKVPVLVRMITEGDFWKNSLHLSAQKRLDLLADLLKTL